MSKPRVVTNPGANQYVGDDERIVEFSDPVTGLGGLISIRRDRDAGGLSVDIYQHDAGVEVRVGKARES